jgi:FKBP-type peptidyl-prolyl cis-trans isomerase 2
MRHLCVLAAAAVLLGGCSKKPAEQGKTAGNAGPTVKFNYTLKVDGKTLESTVGKEPMSVTLGSHEIIPGLEEALAGMKTGDKQTVTVVPEKGYGAYHPEGVKKFPKSAFKDMQGLKPGMVVSGSGKSGQPFQARVKEMDAQSVTLDMNHPLAGKTLSFDVEVIAVQPAGT